MLRLTEQYPNRVTKRVMPRVMLKNPSAGDSPGMSTQNQTQIPAQGGQGQINAGVVKEFLAKQGLPLKIIALGRSRKLAIYVPVRFIASATYSDDTAVLVIKDTDTNNWELVKVILGRDGIAVRNVTIPSRHVEDALNVKLRITEFTFNGFEVKVVAEVSEP